MFTLLVRLFAGPFFKTATGEIKAGWEWLFSSATHILEGLLTLALIFGLWERHEVHSARDDTAKAKVALQKAVAVNQGWQHSFKTERGSVVLLTGALRDQNLAVAGLKTASDQRAAANRAALQSLSQRLQGAEALSDRMKADQGQNSGRCVSPPSFMDAAKGGAL